MRSAHARHVMMAGMRVAHVITGLEAGGAERLLYDVGLHSRHEIQVVSLTGEGLFAERLKTLGVPVHSMGMRSNRDPAGLTRLTGHLRRSRPDAVHVHLYRALLFGRLAARLAGVRTILATEHSALRAEIERRPATGGVVSAYRLAERLGQCTIAVSGQTRDVLVEVWGVPARRIVVVPNGLDVRWLAPRPQLREPTRRRLGIPHHAPVMVSVGRLSVGKGCHLMIEAAARAAPDRGPAHLVFVGDGPLRSELVEHAAAAGLADRVHITGQVEDVRPYLSAADVYVSASRGETFGLAVLEGYVSGLPVVYVDCPGVQTVTSVDTDAFLRVPREAEEIARACAVMGTRFAYPRVIPQQARNLLDVASMVSAWDDIIEGLVRAGPPAGGAGAQP